MAAYTALEPIRHNGVDYAPGAPVDLDADEAAPLLAAGAIAAPSAGSRGDAAPQNSADVVPIGTKVGKGKPAQ